jgi:hypothetical protein
MSFISGMLADAINESEINAYQYDGDRPYYLTGSGSGSVLTSGSSSSNFWTEFFGSGTAAMSGMATATINTFIRVQIMHTDRTLHIEEDIREVFIDYDEDRTIEIETEYRELDVPAEVSYYVS